MKQGIQSVILGSICLFLSACFGGVSAPSTFYILSTDKQLHQNPSVKTSVGVWAVDVPEFLDRPQLVLNETATQLTVSEINRWSEPLPQITQRVLTENLQYILPNSFIQNKGYDDNKYHYFVRTEIIQMSGTLKQDAFLSVWWQIEKQDGTVLYRARFDDKQPAGNTYATYVQAQNKLWGLLSEQIAQKITR
ncbi:MAG: membrane integrity-associated transporter subunit PqiC [Alphaproteobacteria bacterium]|nr:membrane integrity-associated transporter subunit PqiC [Alphaproteobacteria bacterium]